MLGGSSQSTFAAPEQAPEGRHQLGFEVGGDGDRIRIRRQQQQTHRARGKVASLVVGGRFVASRESMASHGQMNQRVAQMTDRGVLGPEVIDRLLIDRERGFLGLARSARSSS